MENKVLNSLDKWRSRWGPDRRRSGPRPGRNQERDIKALQRIGRGSQSGADSHHGLLASMQRHQGRDGIGLLATAGRPAAVDRQPPADEVGCGRRQCGVALGTRRGFGSSHGRYSAGADRTTPASASLSYRHSTATVARHRSASRVKRPRGTSTDLIAPLHCTRNRHGEASSTAGVNTVTVSRIGACRDGPRHECRSPSTRRNGPRCYSRYSVPLGVSRPGTNSFEPVRPLA